LCISKTTWGGAFGHHKNRITKSKVNGNGYKWFEKVALRFGFSFFPMKCSRGVHLILKSPNLSEA